MSPSSQESVTLYGSPPALLWDSSDAGSASPLRFVDEAQELQPKPALLPAEPMLMINTTAGGVYPAGPCNASAVLSTCPRSL